MRGVRTTPLLINPLTAAGLNGLMDPVEPGLACGSDTAHMSLFGYDPRM
jgi:2,3-bisphosphoglycerate-independent phosphoglycerate mutase